MSQPKIVLCFPVENQHVVQIQETVGSSAEIIVSDQGRIAEDLFEATVFCGHAKVPVDWPEVVRQGRLKWIQSSAAGLDHCLVPAVVDSEIVVSGCSALFANQVAEQSMALLYGLVRSLPTFFRAQLRREYIRRPTDEIHDANIGIIGFGGNGQRIAQVLRPVVGKILATDCFYDEVKMDGVEVLAPDQTTEVFARSKVTLITLPLTQKNECSIGDEQFSAAADSSYVINVGRGSVVDHDSLVKHLQNGSLAGAGIDVADPEPIPDDHPLWQLGNLLITPHVGAQSAHRVNRTVDLFCENLVRHREGQTLINLVDKILGFPRPENRWNIS